MILPLEDEGKRLGIRRLRGPGQWHHSTGLCPDLRCGSYGIREQHGSIIIGSLLPA